MSAVSLIDDLEVSTYRVPTQGREADGTLTWDACDAAAMLDCLADYRIAWVEEPVSSDNLAGRGCHGHGMQLLRAEAEPFRLSP